MKLLSTRLTALAIVSTLIFPLNPARTTAIHRVPDQAGLFESVQTLAVSSNVEKDELPESNTAEGVVEVTNAASGDAIQVITDRTLLSLGKNSAGVEVLAALSANGHSVSVRPDLRFEQTPATLGQIHSLAEGAGNRTCFISESGSLIGCNKPAGHLDGESFTKISVVRLNNLSSQTCALSTSGYVLCWLNNGTVVQNFSGQLAAPASIGFGYQFGCYTTASGGVYCWGREWMGVLGNGKDTTQTIPLANAIPVAGVSDAKQVVAAYLTACTLTRAHQVWCWGYLGEQRNGIAVGSLPQIINVGDILGYPVALSSSGNGAHVCAVLSDGRVKCWGGNQWGETGQPAAGFQRTPTVVPLPEPVVHVATGDGSSCALTISGRVLCWGSSILRNLPDPHMPRYIQGFMHATPTLQVLPPVSVILPGSKPGKAFADLSLVGPTGVPVSDQIVRIRSNRPEHVDFVSPYTGTLRSGRFIAEITSTLPGGVLVEASNLTSAWDMPVSATLQFVVPAGGGMPGGERPSTPYAHLVASPREVTSLAGQSTLTLTLFDAEGQPWQGQLVRFHTSRPATDVLAPSAGSTDRDGRLTATLRTTEPGMSWITATLMVSGEVLSAVELVKFELRESYLRADKEYVAANGVSHSLVELRLYDDQGVPVAGKQIEFQASLPGVVINPRRGETNSEGRLTARVSSSSSGKATITAHDLTANVTLPLSTQVRFIGPNNVVGEVFADPDVFTTGLYSRIVAHVLDVNTGGVMARYPVRFEVSHPGASIEYTDDQSAILRATVSGTVVVTAYDNIFSTVLGRTEVKVRSGCVVRPKILNFVPSFVLGADVAYPHVPALPMPLDSNIEVDWGGCVPGRFEFYLENGKSSVWELLVTRPEQVKTHYAVRSFNLTEDLPIGKSKLKIVARTKDGLESLPLFVDVLASEWPEWLVNVMGFFNPEDTIIMDSVHSDGTNMQSTGSLAKMFAIAKIWPDPKGWTIEPMAVLLEKPDTPYTDDKGQAKKDQEAKDIIKKHSTKVMLRGSLNLWLACDLPPALMFQIFASKKEVAKVGPVSLGGMANVNITGKLDRNYLCFFMPPFNQEYYTQGQASGSVSVDVYVQWKEALPKFLSTFIPPLRPWSVSVCEAADRLKVFASSLPPELQPPSCDVIFGEVYARLGLTTKAGFKWALTRNESGVLEPHFLEGTTEIGPKLAVGYERATPYTYINLEGNVIVVYKWGTSRPVPMTERAPLSEIALNAEAFATVNLFNLLHSEPKWTYTYKWALIEQPKSLAAANIFESALSRALAEEAPLPDAVAFQPISPAAGLPDYSQFRNRSAFAYLQDNLTPQGVSGVRQTAVVTTLLASGNLTYSEVSLAHNQSTGQTLLVWTHDAPNRPTGGSREIYYSLWDGASWSTPQALTSDNLPDVAPQVSWLGHDRAIVVWNRAQNAVSDMDDLNKLEIAYAIYNTATQRWSQVRYLTQDNAPDFSITLSRNPQGDVLVAWISVEEEGTAIETAFFDGQSAQGQTVRRSVALRSEGGISKLSSAFGNGKAALAYASYVPFTGEVVTPSLRVSALLWDRATESWSEPIAAPLRGIYEEGQDSPAVIIDEEDTAWLAYIRSGREEVWGDQDGDGNEEVVGTRELRTFEIRTLQDLVPREASVEIDTLQVDRMKLLKGNRGFVAVLVGSDSQRDLHAMVATSRWHGWSKPINLTADSASETSFDAYMSGDNLHLGYVRTTYTVVTQVRTIEEDVITYTRRQATNSDLVALSKALRYQPDLTLVSGSLTMTVLGDVALPGSSAVVSATVLNQGDSKTNYVVQVGLYQGNPAEDGILIEQKYLPIGELHAGFTDTITFEWTLPETDLVDLYVVVDPQGIEAESNKENNTASIRVLGPDFRVGAPVASLEGSTVLIDVPVHSVGTTATLPGMLTITLGTPESGILVVTTTVPAITPGSTHTASAQLDVSLFQPGTYPITATVMQVASSGSADQVQERHHLLNLLPNLALDKELEATDLTVPLIRVEGTVRNTSWLTVTDVVISVFDASQRFETGLLMSKTIPSIGPMQSVPISFIINEASPCGLEVWVNPYGFPGTFQEQRFGDNGVRINGIESFCTRAGFAVSTRSGIAPLTVVFTNTSTPNTTHWEWEFGDGTTSTEREPGAHIYTEPGVYTVTLRAASAFTSSVWQERMAIRVFAPAQAEFESDKQDLIVGEAVRFKNHSTGDISSYEWDFGDGNSTSIREPIHAYDRPGRYTVTLTVRGPGGVSTLTRTEHVTVHATRIFLPTVRLR